MQSIAVSLPRIERIAAWRFRVDPGPSLLGALFPSAGAPVRLAVAVAFIGVMAGLAQARFYLPGNPVPVTLQTLGVLLAGGVLGWRWAFLSVAGYYLLGMAGVPVFQGGQGGWHYVAGSVTGGYLLGFLVSAPVVAFLTQRGWNRNKVLWPMLLGTLVVYVPALLWLSIFDFGWPGEGELLSAGVYPFLPGDLLKLALAALAAGAGWHYADFRGRRRSAAANASAIFRAAPRGDD